MKDEVYISPTDQLREIHARIVRSIELTEEGHQNLTQGINDIIGEIDNIMGTLNGSM